jgi:hypothetical protein
MIQLLIGCMEILFLNIILAATIFGLYTNKPLPQNTQPLYLVCLESGLFTLDATFKGQIFFYLYVSLSESYE